MNSVDHGGFTKTDAYGNLDAKTTVPPVTLRRAGCGLHPGYRGIRPPRLRCRTCRAFFEVTHR